MRVITGAARGRRLMAPPGTDTRPTTEMVKEAVFSAIQFEVEGARVLDLFAGSGQMGIEALSRGASSCVFVEHARSCQTVLRRNLETTGMSAGAKLVPMDAFSFLRSAPGPFDVVFLDPPYGQGLAQKALQALEDRMAPGGVIFCETGREEKLPERLNWKENGFALYRQYRYGKIKVSQYRISQGNVPETTGA